MRLGYGDCWRGGLDRGRRLGIGLGFRFLFGVRGYALFRELLERLHSAGLIRVERKRPLIGFPRTFKVRHVRAAAYAGEKIPVHVVAAVQRQCPFKRKHALLDALEANHVNLLWVTNMSESALPRLIEECAKRGIRLLPVSYTHLTLPTKRIV